MAIDTAGTTNLFEFLVIRDPVPTTPTTPVPAQVHDDLIADSSRRPADIFSPESRSSIGRLVYEQVFCQPPAEPPSTTGPVETQDSTSVRARNTRLVEAATQLITPRFAPCSDLPAPAGLDPIDIATLVGRNYFADDRLIYILPDQSQDIETPWAPLFHRVKQMCRSADRAAEVHALPTAIASLFGAPSLSEVVFYYGNHHASYVAAKRASYDILYLLYVLRRAFAVNLEPALEALRVLHVMEALAIDEYLGNARSQATSLPDGASLLFTLQQLHEPLRGWNRTSDVKGLPIVSSPERLLTILESPVIIHPLFARLHGFRTPFNTIRPIGIGDLKVVRQTPLEYFISDIAHIENVLSGEKRQRVHRRLEKSEDSFTFSSEDTRETQRDSQSTDRFELKREAESTINSSLNVNANASVTYNGATVVASVTGGVAYTQTSNDVAKAGENFAREIVDKAVSRVQSRVSQQRTSTRLLETEETNTHAFDNSAPGSQHISGIYRWVERHFRARTYTYGKRLMFEFVVPEPAAYWVDARMRAFEVGLDVPQPPVRPKPTLLPNAVSALRPEQIDEQQFRRLMVEYDLSEFHFPQMKRTAALVNQATNSSLLSEGPLPDPNQYKTRTFTARVDAKGYRLSKVSIQGQLFFWGAADGGADLAGDPTDENTFEIYINGHPVVAQRGGGWVDNSTQVWVLYPPTQFPVTGMSPLTEDLLTVTFGFWDLSTYSVSLTAEFDLDDDVYYEWRSAVYRKILSIERARADAIDARNEQVYQADLARYKARLGEIKSAAFAELLSGSSPAANRQVVVNELKKHCISFLAREFDLDTSDDYLSTLHGMNRRSWVDQSRTFRIDETTAGTTAGFRINNQSVPFSTISLDPARTKGRYIQFIEQAFEWQYLGFLFYPYYWTSPERWVDTLMRDDPADPQFAAFLRAGSSRVLLAVTPAYESAVLHFLATGEPWDGGQSPVIGDPLFLPLHEELRRQSDDRNGGRPDGTPWDFTLPTALVYLDNSSIPLPGSIPP